MGAFDHCPWGYRPAALDEGGNGLPPRFGPDGRASPASCRRGSVRPLPASSHPDYGILCHRPAHIDSGRSEEHTSALQSLMRISYAVFCLNKNKNAVAHAIHGLMHAFITYAG